MRTTISGLWRWTVVLAASVALAACPHPAAPPPSGAEPIIRVALLIQADQVTIGAQGSALGAARGVPELRLGPGDSVVLTADGAAFVTGGVAAGRYEQLAFASTMPERFVTVNGRPFRGAVEAFARAGGITVVNALPLEQYLQGVVNAELGRRAPSEQAALEAQAAVARTNALRNRGRYAADGYDLLAGVGDQLYGGVAAETELGIAAVRATVGLALLYHGSPIAAFFHSTCGGSTAAPEESFQSVRGAPYLRSVSDARPGGGTYCDISPRFEWTVEWEGSQLRGILRRTMPAVLGIDSSAVAELRDVYVRRSGPSGRATDVRVRVAAGEIPVPGYAVRTVFQTPDGRPLGASAVRFEARQQDGALVSLVARGRGWGHGVGLCQWGAVGRARAGQDVRTILNAYFPGTTLARAY
jgi:stage II sporulation protein D